MDGDAIKKGRHELAPPDPPPVLKILFSVSAVIPVKSMFLVELGLEFELEY